MTTWVNHLRVAENILNRGYKLDKTAFVAGNIAPDAGMPNQDWSNYDPPGSTTHFRDAANEIHPEEFYANYIAASDDIANGSARYSFLLGYYVHLLTDIVWGNLINRKKMELASAENPNADPKFIKKEVTKDSVGLEFKYLRENRDFIFFTCYQHILEVPDYLDFFPTGAFNGRFKHIREMYINNLHKNERDCAYLSREELDSFIEEAACFVKNHLHEIPGL